MINATELAIVHKFIEEKYSVKIVSGICADRVELTDGLVLVTFDGQISIDKAKEMSQEMAKNLGVDIVFNSYECDWAENASVRLIYDLDGFDLRKKMKEQSQEKIKIYSIDGTRQSILSKYGHTVSARSSQREHTWAR